MFRVLLIIATFLYVLTLESNGSAEGADTPVCTGVSGGDDSTFGSCLIVAKKLISAVEFKEIFGVLPSADITPSFAQTISPETERILIARIEQEKMKLRQTRLNAVSKRFIRGCFNAEKNSGAGLFLSGLFDACTLRRSNKPNTIEATLPASFSFTRDLRAAVGEQANTFEIASAFKGTKGLSGNGALFFAAEYQRNNTENSQQANLNLGVGKIFDIAFGDKLSNEKWEKLIKRSPSHYDIVDSFSSYRFSFDASYNRMGVFGTPQSDPCIADPSLPFCSRQNLNSLRLQAAVSPYFDFLNGVSGGELRNSTRVHWAISPTASVFYDTALNSDVVLPSGPAIDGGVFGVTAGVEASLTPGLMQNRWKVSVSTQIIETLDRSDGRITTFEDTSRQFIASLSFALRERAFINAKPTESPLLIPAIAVTYTNGSDSLRGRSGRETLIVALTLLY